MVAAFNSDKAVIKKTFQTGKSFLGEFEMLLINMNHCSTQMNFVNPLRNYVNGRWLDVLKDVYFIHKI